MFDIAFSELLIIAVVGLLVVGPAKLPKAARMLGVLTGRMKRYVLTVRTDIERELQAGELGKLQQDAESGATRLDTELKQELRSVEKGATTLTEELGEVVAMAREAGR